MTSLRKSFRPKLGHGTAYEFPYSSPAYDGEAAKTIAPRIPSIDPFSGESEPFEDVVENTSTGAVGGMRGAYSVADSVKKNFTSTLSRISRVPFLSKRSSRSYCVNPLSVEKQGSNTCIEAKRDQSSDPDAKLETVPHKASTAPFAHKSSRSVSVTAELIPSTRVAIHSEEKTTQKTHAETAPILSNVDSQLSLANGLRIYPERLV